MYFIKGTGCITRKRFHTEVRNLLLTLCVVDTAAFRNYAGNEGKNKKIALAHHVKAYDSSVHCPAFWSTHNEVRRTKLRQGNDVRDVLSTFPVLCRC